ncbi:replication initiation protein [Candidatus Cetobacterium colombiensis]|uniref:Replication initiation protein n=1 Tax=Candidatus Cetobacterium colombiensis TaxID=3073100 RepID=A0ABU4WEI3_9FUSO|nr:replication initiation protein [Candidatus Cetobacterium colombiensis]MDX8337402.1 replication initiation protein [Candidatus Cetobacterium colombiensis]
MDELVLRNELTAFINDYNEAELALFLVLCKQIQNNELDNVDGKAFFQIKYSNLFLGKNYTARELEFLIENFYKKSIKTTLVDDLTSANGIHLGKKGDIIDNVPFYSILANSEERVFNCFVNPFLISFIKEIIGNFTILDIEKVFRINGKYARKLYLLIVRYKNKADNYKIANPEEKFEINFLKDIVGYDKTKPNKEFLRLLKKITGDIGEFIPGLSYDTLRNGRSISNIKFSWDLEKKIKNNDHIEEIMPTKENEKKSINKKLEKTLKYLENERNINLKTINENSELDRLYNLFENFSNDIKNDILKKAKEFYQKEIEVENMNETQLRAFELSKKSIILKVMKGEI